MSLGLRRATLQKRNESLATNDVLSTSAERGSRGSYCRQCSSGIHDKMLDQRSSAASDCGVSCTEEGEAA